MVQLSDIRDPEIRALAGSAVSFLERQSWCAKVVSGQVAFAVPEVLGIFLLQLEPSKPNVDRSLWVVVGDLPPAYLVCDDAPDWRQALARYSEEMSRWVRAVKTGASLDQVIPVNAAATLENAESLERRLEFIVREILSTPAEAFDSDI